MNIAMGPTKKRKCSKNVNALLNKHTLISTIGYWFYKFQYYYYLVYYLQIPFQTMDICVYIYIYIYILKSPQLRFKSCALRTHFYSCGLLFLGLRFLSQRIYYQCHAFWAVRLVCSGFDSCCNYCNYNIII